MRRFLARVRAWTRPRAADAAMRREMASHLALIEEDFERQGLSPAAARRAARIHFGNGDAAAERHRDTRGFVWMAQIGRDTRLAARSLCRAPAFTLAAVLTLAVGLGAAVAVFTVVNSVLLEPLPYPQAGRLVAVRQLAPGAGALTNSPEGLDLSLSMYVTYAEHNRSFSAMGVWDAGTSSITGSGQPEQVPTVEVSDGVLQALAVPPLLGRWFTPADQDLHQSATVMLSYGYWQRRFGGATSVLGQVLDVDGHARTIVGVMPRGFRVVEQDADLILPIAIDRGQLRLAGFGYEGLARLRPGSSLRSADADLARLIPVWMDSWTNCAKCDPHFYQRWRITPAMRPLRDDVVGGVTGVLWAVMGTIGLVLLIAVGNVINLFLVRAQARQHELAVRAALGAGTARLAQLLLIEALGIAAAGGAIGLGLAQVAVLWLQGHGLANLPRLTEIAIHGRVVAFAVGLALLTALAAGLAPLWHRASTALAPTLSSESRTASGSRHSRHVRNSLLVGQMAMAVVLLLVAGLLLRSFAALLRVQPGFAQPQTVQTFRLAIPTTMVASDAMVMRTENNILDQLAAIPGVTSAGMGDQLPMEGFSADWDIMVKRGSDILPGSTPPVRRFSFISPGYVSTLGIGLVAGRDFTWADVYGSRRYLLVSDNLAREFWGGAQAAVGRQISPSGPGNWYQVIGVVADVRQNGPEKPAPSTVYWPALSTGLWGNPSTSTRQVTFAVRTPQADNAALRARIRRAVAAVNPDLPLASYRTLQQIYDRALAVPSFTMVMLAIAGTMALALCLIGTYGVIAYEVSQRRREIGIRMALGASRGAVLRLFVSQGLRLAVLGIGLGLVVAAAVAQALRSLLFGVTARDPWAFVGAPVLLLAVALVASYLPARRAAGAEAVEVLKA